MSTQPIQIIKIGDKFYTYPELELYQIAPFQIISVNQIDPESFLSVHQIDKPIDFNSKIKPKLEESGGDYFTIRANSVLQFSRGGYELNYSEYLIKIKEDLCIGKSKKSKTKSCCCDVFYNDKMIFTNVGSVNQATSLIVGLTQKGFKVSTYVNCLQYLYYEGSFLENLRTNDIK